MPASSVAMRVRYACTAAATSGSAGSPPAAARPSSAATSDTRCARSARRAASAAEREEGGREAWTALLARAAQPAATQALPIAAAMVRTRRGRRCSRARLARRLARAAPAQPTRGSTSAQLDKQASATRRNGNVHAPDIEEDYRRKMRAGDAANCERRCAAHRAVPLRRDARTPSERARKMPGKYLAHACARECTAHASCSRCCPCWPRRWCCIHLCFSPSAPAFVAASNAVAGLRRFSSVHASIRGTWQHNAVLRLCPPGRPPRENEASRAAAGAGRHAADAGSGGARPL